MTADLSEVRKLLTVQLAITFNKFVELVIQSTNGKGRVADVKAAVGAEYQSSLMKQLNMFDKTFHLATSEHLYIRSPDKSWQLTNVGLRVYAITKEIEANFGKMDGWLARNVDTAFIKVALGAFSYHTFRTIEKQMLSITPNLTYKKHFETLKNNKIFDEIETGSLVDVGISESLHNITSTQMTQVLQVAADPIVLMSNFRLDDSLIDADGLVRTSSLREIPLLLGHTATITEYLFALQNVASRTGLLSDGRNLEEMWARVIDQYDIQGTSTSINILLDMVLLGTKNVSLLAAPEVRRHLNALRSDHSYGVGEDIEKREIWEYRVEDGGLQLLKFALRKQRWADSPQRQAIEVFWTASERVAAALVSSSPSLRGKVR